MKQYTTVVVASLIIGWLLDIFLPHSSFFLFVSCFLLLLIDDTTLPMKNGKIERYEGSIKAIAVSVICTSGNHLKNHLQNVANCVARK